ncbi:MAG TPA: SIS domain-containing protein, partial [Emcibacteraceae bacterium]|nr:SIS domain-containing protein [Emcibacteraceae bacterium]
MKHLNLSQDLLTEKGAILTAQEIEQQPHAWKLTQNMLGLEEDKIQAFLSPLINQKNLRIIFTGAGTSSFIGACIAPMLSEIMGRQVETIATTDLVSSPKQYLMQDRPTLIVSFSRSGGSPESVATVDYADQIISDCYHLVFTCNKNGELFKRCAGQKNSLAILLPDLTHDRSFVMTSSYSSMMYAALTVFIGINKFSSCTDPIIASGKQVLTQLVPAIEALVDKKYDRIVYLGSNGFYGLAQEASLKLLEMTDGEIITMSQSPLGFRHGPKTIINKDTLVIIFMSNDPFTRQFDLDLLQELRHDGEVGQIIALTARKDEEITKGDFVFINDMDTEKDYSLLFPFAIWAQIFAFYQTYKIENSPDSP